MATALWGGFAEKLVTPAQAVHPIPEGMDMVTASVITGAYGTSYHALRDRAHIQPGETLLVLGAAGGVGLAAVEIGAAMGARVIAAASSAERLELCREHGAAEVIDYSSEDMRARLKDITGGAGVDVVYDPVGGPYSEPALRSTGWNGRFLVVGFAAGDIPRIPLNLPLLKGCQIVGVFWGAAVQRDPALLGTVIADLGRMWREGQIRPHVSQTFTLPEAAGALEALAERRVQGKAVIVTALHAAAV
jgi:NADPH2:quinone reductase